MTGGRRAMMDLTSLVRAFVGLAVLISLTVPAVPALGAKRAKPAAQRKAKAAKAPPTKAAVPSKKAAKSGQASNASATPTPAVPPPAAPTPAAAPVASSSVPSASAAGLPAATTPSVAAGLASPVTPAAAPVPARLPPPRPVTARPAVSAPAGLPAPATATSASTRAPAPAVALAQAATTAQAASVPAPSKPGKPAKPGKTAKAQSTAVPAPVSPSVALPAAATPAVGLARDASATALAGDATPSHAGPAPKRLKAPVATAGLLPQVAASKLKSDVDQASIVRLVRAGQFGDALAQVDALLAVSPQDDELRLQRARLLYWLDRRDTARQELNPLLERHPEDPEARELDAQLLLAAGNLRAALAQYRALEVAGDGRPELHQRVIDLALELEEHEAVAKSLRYGGHLSEEQEMAYTRLAHPWFVDVSGATTLHSGGLWGRTEAHLGRRLNKRFSVLLGGIFEQRNSGGEIERAAAAKGELYFGFGPVDGMLHLEGSPNKSILPAYDGRLDLALSLVKAFSIGLYGRYAHYSTEPTSQTLPTTAWTLAPNLVFYHKEWTFQPGYMLIHLDPAATVKTNFFHTGFLKVRWEPTPRWMAFAWLYAGTDPTFVERYGVQTPVGLSAVLGGERWWTPRWGTRLSVARVQPFDSKNDSFTEFTLVLRGRL